MPVSSTHVDVIGQIDVRCMSQPGSFTVIIGSGISGDQLARTLTAGGSTILNYNLYVDAARTQIWGDGSPPTATVSGIRRNRGRQTFYNYPVYGRIFAGQPANPGVYSDNLIVTVLF
jgi:spore coat protein U-like protein